MSLSLGVIVRVFSARVGGCSSDPSPEKIIVRPSFCLCLLQTGLATPSPKSDLDGHKWLGDTGVRGEEAGGVPETRRALTPDRGSDSWGRATELCCLQLGRCAVSAHGGDLWVQFEV